MINFIEKIAKLFSLSIKLIILVYVIAFPLCLLLGFAIRAKRKALQKVMSYDKKTVSTNEEYVSRKQEIQFLKEIVAKISRLNSVDISTLPNPVKFPLNQIKKFNFTIGNYLERLDLVLAQYNKKQFDTSEDTFKLRGEKELWDSRNKNYQYWM